MEPTLTADAELAAPKAPETAIALTQSQRDELAELARQTFEAAEGDSNDEEIEALQEFRDVALDVLGIETDTDAAVSTELRTTTAASLLTDYEQNGRVPYAIISESTGGYAVIEGEIYRTYDGNFIHIEVDTGVLRLSIDEEEITVADTRGDVPHPDL